MGACTLGAKRGQLQRAAVAAVGAEGACAGGGGHAHDHCREPSAANRCPSHTVQPAPAASDDDARGPCDVAGVARRVERHYTEAVHAARRPIHPVREARGRVGMCDGVSSADGHACVRLATVERHVNEAVELGGRALTGGVREGNGFFYPPTVLTHVPDGAAVLNEETFGPVAGLFKFSDEAEVIAASNDTEFGLAAYLFTKDAARLFRVSEALEYGIVSVNTGIFSSEVGPFGGVKNSGLGREGSKYGIDEFLEIKLLCIGD